MRRKIALTIIYLGLFSMVCGNVTTTAQHPEAFSDVQLYDRVIDRLFRVDVVSRAWTQLRFTSCESGEMQIVLRRESDSRIRVDVWRLPAGSSTVWDQLSTLSKETAGRVSADQAAARIRVLRDSLVVPAATGKADILDTQVETVLSTLPTPVLSLDAARYFLKVYALETEFVVVAEGPQLPEESQQPVVKWMGQVRKAVEQMIR